MGDRMTSIELPGLGIGHAGIADWGRLEPSEMLRQIRHRAEEMKAEAEAILEAADADFRIQTYVGVRVQRQREVLQKGRTPTTKEGEG